MKEFWTLFNFVDDGFRNSYGRNNPIFEYWSLDGEICCCSILKFLKVFCESHPIFKCDT